MCLGLGLSLQGCPGRLVELEDGIGGFVIDAGVYR